MRLFDNIYLQIHELNINRVFILPILSATYPLIALIINHSQLNIYTYIAPFVSILLSVIIRSLFFNFYFDEKKKSALLNQNRPDNGRNYKSYYLLLTLGMGLCATSFILTDFLILEYPFIINN